MLAVNLLQTPSILLDGNPVTFPFKRADALLYYMLVRRSATRQELIALLWESCDAEVGLKNLRNTLYTLKKTLGGDLLLSPQKSLVVLNDRWEIDCDYDHFCRDNDFAAYRGPFLQGFSVKNAFSYEEWLGRTREKLHAQYLDALSQRSKSAREAGDLALAQQYASDYLREDPLDEKMACSLMQLYQESDQYPKAALVYQHLKEGLLGELGADPLKQTTALYYEIMNDWNATTAPDEDASPAPVPVGREAVYARMRGAVSAFCEPKAARQGSLLLIGEAGSGKSELINHFLRGEDLSELSVLRAGCLLSKVEEPLSCWDSLMLSLLQRGQSEELSLPPSARTRLGEAFSLFETEGAPIRIPRRKTDSSLIDTMLLLFSVAAKRRKFLLILEDIQWLDLDSLVLLDALLRRSGTGTLMAVLTCRDNCPAETQQRLEGLTADGLLLEQRLQPLTRADTAEFLRRELGEEASVRLSGQFYRETGGNLYLLTELTAAYRQSGDIEHIIANMGDILLGRITGLSRAAVQAAERIAVFPDFAPCGLLATLSTPDDLSLGAGVEELCRRGLIYERREEQGSCYYFTHPRIRELVYDRQSFFQRKPLHLQIAVLMTESGALHTVLACRRVAWHYSKAGEPLLSLEWEIRALEEESARCCEPFPLLTERMAEIDPAAVTARLAAVQTRLASLRREGERDVFTRYDRMLTLIGGRIALFEGRFTDGVALLGNLSEHCDSEEERELFLRACQLLATHALNTQAADLAERYTSAGIRLLERKSDPARLAMFERLRGNCFCLRGEYEKSVYYLLEAIDALGKLPNRDVYRFQLAAAYYDYGRICRQRLDYAEASAQYKKALALIGEEESCPGAVWLYVHYGRAVFALGDHPRAHALFLQGNQLGQKTGEKSGVTAAAAFCAYYEAQNDNFERAADLLLDAQRISQEVRAPLEEVILCFVKMQIRASLDREGRQDIWLSTLLPSSAESYARQGTRLLAGVPDVFEAQLLATSLRDGIAHKRTYRVPELYSKNKHFMTE